MPTPNSATNPFAMMLDPQAVLAQVMHSERLSRLQSRICRPLDKPLLGTADGEADDSASEDDGAGSVGSGANDNADLS